MNSPRFTNSLHFRLSAIFMLLMAVSAGAYWWWINATVLDSSLDEAEQVWYFEKAENELDELALDLGSYLNSAAELQDRLVDYGQDIFQYDAEVIVFDASGRYLSSSNPDSLVHAVTSVETTLLEQMATPSWDYSVYPIDENVDAYENRIFEVDRLYANDKMDAPVTGYLVASSMPLVIGVEELAADSRTLGFQAIVLMLLNTTVVGLLMMFWTSRRIRKLSISVGTFADGDLGHRISHTSSADEIGSLSRNFNNMAVRIEEMVQALKQKEQFQRQLIANISHDLRTPMSSLRGYMETLQMGYKNMSEAERARYMDIITSNFDHLNDLVDHMLVLSRFDTGQAVFQMEEFPLGELAESVLVRCEKLAADKSVNLILDADEAMPMVNADPLQIAQVLQNLIENGIKFNRPGGRVQIKLAAAGRIIKVEVSDTGLGIAPEDLPHIFERFFTCDRSRTRHATSSNLDAVRQHLGQSTGLGLSIAAKIVAGHDSRLTVDSALDEGTTFRFTLQQAGELEAEQGQA